MTEATLAFLGSRFGEAVILVGAAILADMLCKKLGACA